MKSPVNCALQLHTDDGGEERPTSGHENGASARRMRLVASGIGADGLEVD